MSQGDATLAMSILTCALISSSSVLYHLRYRRLAGRVGALERKLPTPPASSSDEGSD